MTSLYIAAGFWSLLTLAVFINAIRLSYRIERLAGPPNKLGIPVNTNIFATAFGSRGRGDPDVDAVRRLLRIHLAVVALMLAAAWAAFAYLDPSGGAR